MKSQSSSYWKTVLQLNHAETSSFLKVKGQAPLMRLAYQMEQQTETV